MYHKTKNRKGFTLIEVLVVALIVMVLSSIAISIYNRYILKSRAAEAVNLLEMVKERQQLAFATSRDRHYVSKASSLTPLTGGSSEVKRGDDLIVHGNYTLTLNATDQCAVVIYKEQNQERFRFAMAYDKPGLGCSGAVCNSFGDSITEIDSVCTVEDAADVCAYQACDIGQYWSNSACSCTACPACEEGYHFSGVGCGCVRNVVICEVQECAPGKYWSSSTCNCEPLPDPTCDLECPTGKIPNSDCSACVCENNPNNLEAWAVCSGSQYRMPTFNEATCECGTAPCSPGHVWDSTDHSCKQCWEINLDSDGDPLTPYWNGSECVSCIAAFPARVKCSNTAEGEDYQHETNSGIITTSAPMRFTDYLAAHNHKDLSSYAYKAGALLAETNPNDNNNNCTCGFANCGGSPTVTGGCNGDEPPCNAGMQGHSIDAVCETYAYNPTSEHNEMVVGGTIRGTCICNDLRWDCSADPNQFYGSNAANASCRPAQQCPPLNVSYTNTPYNCVIQEHVIGGNINQPTQPSCSESWAGANQYDRARPIWNSSSHTCVACEATPQNCQPNGSTGYFYLSGEYWDGQSKTCTTIPSRGLVGQQTIAGYSVPSCTANNRTVITYLYCTGQQCTDAYYFKTPYDRNSAGQGGNSAAYFQDQAMLSSNLNSSVYGLLYALPERSETQIMTYGVRDKGYYALSQLGLAPNLTGENYVVVE